VNERPEWVTCVARAGAETWCGQKNFGFTFTGWDHAVRNADQQRRLTTCPDCVRGLVELFASEGGTPCPNTPNSSQRWSAERGDHRFKEDP
jgi:hypothetical protein